MDHLVTMRMVGREVVLVEVWYGEDEDQMRVVESATFTGPDAWCSGMEHYTKMEDKYYALY